MGQEQEEAYSLTYHHLAAKEARELDSFWREKISFAIEERLLVRPELFGKPLRRTLRGCWALRVGDYRVVYRIENRAIRILAIVHRSSDYKGIEKRI